MSYILKLKKGGKSLQLSSGIYTLSDWIPPRANIISNIASGTSANRYGGGVKVSERAVNTSTVFSVRIKGDSNAECEAGARRIENFLRQAGDEAEPLYLEWRPKADVGYEPLYGQFGANIRYEVVSGQVDRWNAYFIAETRNTTMFVNVMLELKPFATGKRQILALATGAVFEETQGTSDGTSRGVGVQNAHENLITNPIFGHATWDTDWNDAADVISTQNTDPEFVLFGDSSVKLVRTGSGSYIYQNYTATDTSSHTLSAFVKRQDGAAVTASDVQGVYDTAQDFTVFKHIGNGWYRCKLVVSGIASPTAVGVKVLANTLPVYVDGVQFEDASNWTPLIHGDMLGCTWSGTAHESSSVSATAFLKIPISADTLNVGQGTIRVIWKTLYSSSDLGTDTYLFYMTNGMHLRYDGDTDVWIWHDGTNAIDSDADTFARNSVHILHCTYDAANGLALYRNGVELETGATYTAADQGDYIFIGTDNAGANHCFGVFEGFTTFGRAMTAAEVAADATNIKELTDSGDGLGVAIDPIPWMWTKDGDNVVDNCNDSTRDNFAVVGGVAGNVRAETEYRLAMSNIAARQTIIGVMTHQYGDYVKPDNYLWGEYSGSTDANSSGSAYYLKANVGDSGVTLIGNAAISMTQYGVEALLGKDIYMVARLYDGTASSLKLYPDTPFIPLTSIREYRTTTMPGTVWGLHYTGPISLPSRDLILQTLPYTSRSFSSKTFALYGQHVSGTSDVRIDFFSIIPRPMAILGDGNAVTGAGFVLNGRDIIEVNSTFTTVYEPSYMSGDIIDLYPNQYNVLLSHVGYASDADMSRTLTYNAIYVKPRYSLA